MKRLIYLLFIIPTVVLSQNQYFFQTNSNFISSIPSPEQFLGYPIGERHTRYDKVVEYIKELDRLSDKMTSQIIGYTYEHRPQIVATITSVPNHSNLEAIRQNNLARASINGGNNTMPLVVTLGYNVHGNEPSSTEAAMLTAYYLVANESDETKKWLDGMVILLDPCYNPDGRDRHTHWANMHKGQPPVADPLDREHNEIWPGGRTNHYWFDLNRDWFLGIHPESKNRIKLFHDWMPYVMTDHHEMGTNSTFYFDPGKYSSNNPIVPSYLYDVVYPKYGEYFSKATNAIGSLYYTKESFDKLYPGYGSSYVNFYGGAGFLFEQASSRGHVQNTTTIPLTFAFTIRNQATASLATLRASHSEKEMLIKCRRDFYTTTSAQAKANPIKAYLFGDMHDESRTNAFVNLLRLHKIEVYQNDQDQTIENKKFAKGKSYIVPTDQKNYLMVRSCFEKGITYADSLFYDASTWSLIHSFNLPYIELKSTTFSKGAMINTDLIKKAQTFSQSTYGYIIKQTEYVSYKTIHKLVSKNIITQVAFKPFSISANGTNQNFSYGTLFIPVQPQALSTAELYSALKLIAEETGVDVFSVDGAYASAGIDLGSNFMRTLKPVKPLMIIGQGTNGYEVGEVWHLLDQRISMPITKVEMATAARLNLNDYTTVILTHGAYTFDKIFEDKLKSWIASGGTLITFKGASEWAVRAGITRERIVPNDTMSSTRIDYIDLQNREGAKALGGSIFEADLDLSHPLGYGFTDRKISVYKNNTTVLMPSRYPVSTVAKYTAKPLIGGYLHKSQESRIANNAALVCAHEGAGRVILFADNPNFRAVWYGTNKLFLNALFFGGLINQPVQNFSGED